MRQYRPGTQSGTRSVAQARIATRDHDRMMRGLVHGVILSLAVWLTAGYLTLMMR